MAVVGEDERGRTASPAGKAREPVRAVADEGEPVGYRGGGDPVTLPDGVFVGDHLLASVELDDPLADYALGEVLVGGADDDLIHPRVLTCDSCRRGEGIVCLELDHRPHFDPEALQGLLQHRELRLQLGGYRGACLVAGPQVVAKRLDHVICGDAEVGDSARQQGGDRPHDASRCPHLGAVVGERGRASEELAEQLVGAVDEVDLHDLSLTRLTPLGLWLRSQNLRSSGRCRRCAI